LVRRWSWRRCQSASLLVEKRSWHLGHCMIIRVSPPGEPEPHTCNCGGCEIATAGPTDPRSPGPSGTGGRAVGGPVAVRRHRSGRAPAAPDHHLAAGPDRRRAGAGTTGERPGRQGGPVVGRRAVAMPVVPAPPFPATGWVPVHTGPQWLAFRAGPRATGLQRLPTSGAGGVVGPAVGVGAVVRPVAAGGDSPSRWASQTPSQAVESSAVALEDGDPRTWGRSACGRPGSVSGWVSGGRRES
jgi:hypothetical protein